MTDDEQLVQRAGVLLRQLPPEDLAILQRPDLLRLALSRAHDRQTHIEALGHELEQAKVKLIHVAADLRAAQKAKRGEEEVRRLTSRLDQAKGRVALIEQELTKAEQGVSV